MPSNVKTEDLQKCAAPTFVIGGKLDCMFPGRKVIEKAKKMIPNVKTYLLENQGHMFIMPDNVMDMIEQFINEC
jgi:pimeloyl-ACP methyl ester carboxylesterase